MKYLIVLTALVYFSCTNNNQNTGGTDSSSVSTNPGMQGITGSPSDSGMSSSDSTDIRFPMNDSNGRGRTASGALVDSSKQ